MQIQKWVMLTLHSRTVKLFQALQPFLHNQPFQHSATHHPPLLLPQCSKKRGRRRKKDCSRRRFVHFLIARGSHRSDDHQSSNGTSSGTYLAGFVAHSRAVVGTGTASTCYGVILERSIETLRSSSMARRESKSTMRRG